MQLSKKLLLSFTSLGLALTVSMGDADAKQEGQTQTSYNKFDYKRSLDAKVLVAQKEVNNFKRNRTIKNHRAAQRAVNRIPEYAHKSYAIEKQKLQKSINIVVKYNKLK